MRRRAGCGIIEYVMEILKENGNIILCGAADFDLTHIFECGQCFRWEREPEGTYLGVARGKALRIGQEGKRIIFFDTTEADFQTVWRPYFDLDTDYGRIKAVLSRDPVMQKAVAYGNGIRLLRQDPWECIVSFIVSAGNNIPRIKKIIGALCRAFGDPLEYRGRTYYTFPGPDRLANLAQSDLACIKAGFRDKYILDAAKQVSEGRVGLCALEDADDSRAREMLMQISGVGSKVADCILLFGLSRRAWFPVDVWIRRVIQYYYFHDAKTAGDVAAFSRERFGPLGGFAQQYLFFYARENKIGIA